MRYRVIAFVVCLLFTLCMSAQRKKGHWVHQEPYPVRIGHAYRDSLAVLWNKYIGILDSLNNDTLPERRIGLDPKYYKLFVPFTFYPAAAEEAFITQWKPFKQEDIKDSLMSVLFPLRLNKSHSTKDIDKRVNRILLDLYVAHPEWVEYTEAEIAEKKIFKKEIVQALPAKVKMIDLFKPDPVYSAVGEAELFIRKPNFWSFGGNGALQFTQNYISKNWYKGGESTNSMVSQLQLVLNYDDKQRWEFDNMLEMKLGFITAPADTVHKYKTNSDLFRISSKLGLKAVSYWYYTLSAEFNTQFFSNYETNTNNKISSFMAPANVIVSIGMDYKLNKKRISLSVFLSPLTYNFRYVGNKDVNPTAFGIKEGKKTLNEVGSRLQTNIKWIIIPAVIWESRLYYFTNYKRVEAEWENSFNFVLNRFLSTKLFVHARFDDGVKPKDDHSYFQVKELLSFGINYTW